jgi:hypothetical protein
MLQAAAEFTHFMICASAILLFFGLCWSLPIAIAYHLGGATAAIFAVLACVFCVGLAVATDTVLRN